MPMIPLNRGVWNAIDGGGHGMHTAVMSPHHMRKSSFDFFLACNVNLESQLANITIVGILTNIAIHW